MPAWPVIGDDDVVSAQLLAERLHEDAVRISVDATVLEQNIRSPYVTNMRQQVHFLSEYLYTTDRIVHSVKLVHVCQVGCCLESWRTCLV